MAKQRIEVGLVRSVNPARRQLRVDATPGGERHLADATWVMLGPREGPELRCRVERVDAREDKPGEFTVTLAPGVTRDSVAKMRFASVTVEGESAPAEYCGPADLLGMEVMDQAGERLGTVTNMYCSGANNVIEIAKRDGGTLLTPVIEPVIARVDVAKNVLVLGDYAPYTVEEPKAAP